MCHQKITNFPLTHDCQGLLSAVSERYIGPFLEETTRGAYLADIDVSGSAGWDSGSGSYADCGVGFSGDGWGVSAHGGGHCDRNGHASGDVHVEGSINW